ncbi:hypothetical protein, partial [Streptomyces sp. SID5910]|uniref:hypothetical protein n=1 Tax=Streptomyces sp. SID5910 TaxID=2690312 RepID=UPI00136AAD17
AAAEIPAQASQEPEAAPRRRTRKAAVAEAPVEGAEVKPKARRTRKAVAAKSVESESAEG